MLESRGVMTVEMPTVATDTKEAPIEKPSSVVAVAIAVIPAGVGLIGVASVQWVNRHVSPLSACVLWSLLIIFSCVGWGAGVNLLVSPARRLDGGTHGALGLASLVALGGAFASISIVSRMTVIGSIVAGIAVHGFDRYVRRFEILGAWRRGAVLHALARSPMYTLMVAGLYGLGLFRLGGMASHFKYNAYDDYIAYFGFSRQLLESGSLIEPFSLRRIASFGGQSYLQALVLAFSKTQRMHVLDSGICMLLLMGLVSGYAFARPRTSRGAVLAALLLPEIRSRFLGHGVHGGVLAAASAR
jgi:hypothetical protein